MFFCVSYCIRVLKGLNASNWRDCGCVWEKELALEKWLWVTRPIGLRPATHLTFPGELQFSVYVCTLNMLADVKLDSLVSRRPTPGKTQGLKW